MKVVSGMEFEGGEGLSVGRQLDQANRMMGADGRFDDPTQKAVFNTQLRSATSRRKRECMDILPECWCSRLWHAMFVYVCMYGLDCV